MNGSQNKSSRCTGMLPNAVGLAHGAAILRMVPSSSYKPGVNVPGGSFPLLPKLMSGMFKRGDPVFVVDGEPGARTCLNGLAKRDLIKITYVGTCQGEELRADGSIDISRPMEFIHVVPPNDIARWKVGSLVYLSTNEADVVVVERKGCKLYIPKFIATDAKARVDNIEAKINYFAAAVGGGDANDVILARAAIHVACSSQSEFTKVGRISSKDRHRKCHVLTM